MFRVRIFDFALVLGWVLAVARAQTLNSPTQIGWPGLRLRNGAGATPGAADHAAQLKLAASHVEQGRLQAALDVLSSVLSVEDRHVEALRLRGSVLALRGQLAGAVVDYDRALRLLPDDVELLLKRAWARFQLGEYALALADREAAVRLRPDRPEPRLARAASYHQAGETEKGLDDQNEAIRLEPGAALVWLARGNHYFHSARYEEAVADFRQALALKPDYAVARELLTRAQASAAKAAHLRASLGGQPAPGTAKPSEPEALPAPAQSPAPAQPPNVAATPQPPAADAVAAGRLLDQGRRLIAAEHFTAAAAVLDEAFGNDPRNALIANARGFARLRLGRLEDALADFTIAVELDPRYENALHNRRVVLRVMESNRNRTQPQVSRSRP